MMLELEVSVRNQFLAKKRNKDEQKELHKIKKVSTPERKLWPEYKDWQKIFSHHSYDKGLISDINKALVELYKKK